MNSLPLPGPSLRADTVPPWRSTRLRTIVRPMPRPPCERSSACRSWTNRSKMRGSTSGEMPMPVSRTEQHDLVVHSLRAHRDHAIGRRVLGGVGQQVGDHLAQARRVAVDAQAAPRHVHLQRVLPLLEQRAGHLDRLRDDLRDLDDFGLELDPAARDARDVQQVVDQPREMADLALDDRALAFGSRLAAQLHQLQRRQDRRQRIAQLVARASPGTRPWRGSRSRRPRDACARRARGCARGRAGRARRTA